MNKDKADKIIREVFYKNITLMQSTFDEDETDNAFLVGRVLGKMQKTLEDMLYEECKLDNLKDDCSTCAYIEYKDDSFPCSECKMRYPTRWEKKDV